MGLKMTIILAVLQLLFLARESHGSSYSIVHSKVFRIDTDETVIVNLNGYGHTEVQATIYLTKNRRGQEHFSRSVIIGRADQPLSFSVKVTKKDLGSIPTIENKKVRMFVVVGFQGNAYPRIMHDVRVFLTGESDYMFTQTDRPAYKPGESVRIRAIPLDLRLLPIRDQAVEISVQTPNKIGVWRVNKRFPPNSFIEDTYEIPDDPPLGTWYAVAKINDTLHLSTASTPFLVDKYVLPTYDVKIELDQHYVKPGENFRGKLTAKYSYGEPVIGIYTVKAFVSLPGSDEKLEFFSNPSSPKVSPAKLFDNNNGIKYFTVKTGSIPAVTGRTWEELVEEKAEISLQIAVMGYAEGTWESDEMKGIPITHSPYVIDMSHSSRYYIPAHTHDINIIVRDVATKEPVAGVQVALTVSDVPDNAAATTDENGYVQIVLTPPVVVDEFTITVRTADPSLNAEHQASEVYTLRKYRSRTGVYLRVTAEPTRGTVGNTLYLRFRTPNSRPDAIHYLVLARGLILEHGSKLIVNRGQVSSQAISITRKMTPSIRVVAYYASGRYVISDSIWIDVDDVCTSKELIIDRSAGMLFPNNQLTITVEGEPRALLGITAVDRAAYFLNSEGRLNRMRMFEKMKSFDQGCALTGGRDALSVFEESGLTYTSEHEATPYDDEVGCEGNQEAVRKKRAAPLGSVDEIRTPLERKCCTDGHMANLAKEGCDHRITRVLEGSEDLEETNDEGNCTEAFIICCVLGEQIRDQLSEFNRFARTQLVDLGSQPTTQRKIFSENWIWETRKIGSDGSYSKKFNAPDSITTYDIDAISVHDTKGFCIAEPTTVKVFKELFIQLYLPYSVKVMEQVQIKAAVFNYHPTESQTVELSIKSDENLCTQQNPGTWSRIAIMDIGSRSSASFSFTAIPLRMPEGGNVDILLKVRSLRDDATDEILKELKVEESGSVEEFSGTLSLDPLLPDPDKSFTFHFPDENVVPHSKKCWIYGFMSFLGPIIEFDPIEKTPKNVADSITLPHGCGEQNMISCGPNVFAFNYLKTQGNPRASTVEEIEKFIKAGYARQQRHRNNGIWSVWAGSRGTIWLNAYVNKVFLHARKVWPDMNLDPICKSIKWIISRQQSDGRFSEAQHARYYQINVEAGGDIGLTAYVLLSLLETHIDCEDKNLKMEINDAIQDGVAFLRPTVRQDTIPYTAALTAYALTLHDPSHTSTIDANRRLLDMNITESENVYWRGSESDLGEVALPSWYQSRSQTIDIEATAYALLAQIAIADSKGNRLSQDEIELLNKIARWLVNQQNERGGFQSSQTTVTAIQSLTSYEIWFNEHTSIERNPHLDLVLTSTPGTQWQHGSAFRLDSSNEFYRKEVQIPQNVVHGSSSIAVRVAGEGRGTLSYRCLYRLTRNSEVCYFNINSTVERDTDFIDDAPEGAKKTFIFKISLTTTRREGTKMAIIDIALISGFRPVEASLEQITRSERVDGVIDRYEVSGQNVRFYVNKIPTQGENLPLTLAFKMKQEVLVNNLNPAKILVYDYYEPEVKCSKFYSADNDVTALRTTCAPSSLDDANAQQCKCVEGACPNCRTREEQVTKTCGKRYYCNNACRRHDDCLDLHRKVCDNNFGFLVNISRIDYKSMPMFVKFTGVLLEILRQRGNDANVRTQQERTFIIRADCHERCRDVDLTDKAMNGSYFIVGRIFLITGKEPEKSVGSDGEERHLYYLDQDSILERTLTKEKCGKYKKREKGCEDVNTVKCMRIRKLMKICNNQDTMRKEIDEGCD